MLPATAQISKPVAVRATHTDEEIDQFAQRIAAIVAKTDAFDALLARVEELLATADRIRPRS
jgi:hypothetical protein